MSNLRLRVVIELHEGHATLPAWTAIRDGILPADNTVCWAQEVLDPTAGQVERQASLTRIATAAAAAVTARLWLRHVAIDDEFVEGGKLFLTRYLFRAP